MITMNITRCRLFFGIFVLASFSSFCSNADFPKPETNDDADIYLSCAGCKISCPALIASGSLLDYNVNTFKNIEPRKQRTIKYPYFVRGLAQVGSKVYTTDYCSDAIIPFDATTLELKEPIKVGSKPIAIVAKGNKVYVGNSGEHHISIVDTTTDTVTRIKAGSDKTLSRYEYGISKLIVIDDKLYISNSKDESLSVFDLRHDQEPVKVIRSIKVIDLKSVGNLLYVLTRENIEVIDTEDDQFKGPLFKTNFKFLMKEFTISGDRIYSLPADDYGVFIYDINKKKLIGVIDYKNQKPINAVAIDARVFISWQSEYSISVIDSTSEENTGNIKSPFIGSIPFITEDALYLCDTEKLTQIKYDCSLPQMQ